TAGHDDPECGPVRQRLGGWAARPVSGQSLAVFRIAFGLLMLNDVVHVLDEGWLTRFYIDRAILFPYYGLEVPPLPAPWLQLLWGACGLCCVLVALGAFYRIAIWGFNAIFIYFFLLDQLLYLNHFYMIALFGLLLGCTGAHRCWSLDRRLGRVRGTQAVPRWNLLILQFQVEVILVFAGLVKIEIDWLRGEPLRTWMLERTWSPFSDLFALDWVALAAPVLVILLHVVGAPLLLWSRTRLPVFLVYCAFHMANAHLFNIGVFPWMTIAATTILFSPAWPSVLGRRCGAAAGRLGLRRPVAPGWAARLGRLVAGPRQADGGQSFRPLHPAALAALVLYALVQIWLPVRDSLFEGHVGWTEEGQKFSWRMMLYVHGADGRLIAVSPEEEAWVIDMQAHLDPLQTWMVFAKPEMLLHFVHLMKAHYAETGVGAVRIYADVVKNVNGQPWRRLVDPGVDLAAVDGMNWFREDSWVLRPERSQAAEGLVPDWYPPITLARFSAMLRALGDPEPSSNGEAAPDRAAQK
ncbi:MAG: HTTM domain-containing protein, partial [Alphaproteobacteria bacterium]|nr:HTTM domain-containing protein [Alphaproteobacteria bacterium]